MGFFGKDANMKIVREFEREAEMCERNARLAEKEGRKDAARNLRSEAAKDRKAARDFRKRYGV